MTKAVLIARPSADAGIDDKLAAASLSDGFEALATEYAFRYFLLATFPRGDRAGFADNLVASNWPESLLETYGAGDAFRVSALVSRLKTTIVPVFSNACLFSRGETDVELLGLSERFAQVRLGDTLAFSLHDSDLNHYIIALSGQRGAPSRRERMEIVYAGMTLLDDRRIDRRPQAPVEKLTAREIECLRWSAAGKSSDEIAIILTISSHTVVSYLKSAMRKLNAVNRMQAIARACRYRLL